MTFVLVWVGADMGMRILLAVETWKPQYADAHIIFPAFGFRDQCLGVRFWVSGFGFRVSGSRVSGFGFQNSGFGFEVSGLRFRV